MPPCLPARGRELSRALQRRDAHRVDPWCGDVLVKGADYRKDQVVGAELVEAPAAGYISRAARGLFDDEVDSADAVLGLFFVGVLALAG